jgi:hypothetical protein
VIDLGTMGAQWERLDPRVRAVARAIDETVAALGRIAGVQSTDVNIQGSVAHLHLDALRAPRAVAKLNNDNMLDSAKQLGTGEIVDVQDRDASI